VCSAWWLCLVPGSETSVCGTSLFGVSCRGGSLWGRMRGTLRCGPTFSVRCFDPVLFNAWSVCLFLLFPFNTSRDLFALEQSIVFLVEALGSGASNILFLWCLVCPPAGLLSPPNSAKPIFFQADFSAIEFPTLFFFPYLFSSPPPNMFRTRN